MIDQNTLKAMGAKVATASDIVVIEKQESAIAHKDMHPALQGVINEIGSILAAAQAASLKAFWSVGRLITEVRDDPEKYLTSEQIASHVSADAVVFSIFAPVYSEDQLSNAVRIFDAYPSETEVDRLLGLRCPERPRWRITATHAQLLAQIPDDTKRAAVENRCAEEAYTASMLASELKESRGKKGTSSAGASMRAPIGLKQQLKDLLQHQKRFIDRSRALWLNEDSDNIYDVLANTPADKITETIEGFFAEIEANFSDMWDLISDHVAMCKKIREALFSETTVLDADQEVTAPHSRGITR